MKSLAHLQSLVITRTSLLEQGYTAYWVDKALAEKRAISLRRGAYIRTEQWNQLDPWERYAVESFAYVASAQEPVFSHETAALHLGLWLIHEPPERIHLYNSPHSRGTTRGVLRHAWRGKELPTLITDNGVRTTTVAQTVLDCARVLPLERAVCVADSALQLGQISLQKLSDELMKYSGKGAKRVRRVCDLMSSLSESPGESGTRLLLVEMGIEFIEQYEIRVHGKLYRVDFYLPEYRLIIEFDGAIKYSAFGSRDSAVAMERWREKELQNAGYVLLRTNWSTVFFQPERFKTQLRGLIHAQENLWGRARTVA